MSDPYDPCDPTEGEAERESACKARERIAEELNKT